MNFRKDFPIFNKLDKEKAIYFDSAATTQKPYPVINAVLKFYEEEASNVARGNHILAEKNSLAIESSRDKVAFLLKASPEEIAFTHNATDSINLIAQGLKLEKKDEVLVSLLEHHSNYLPWLERATVRLIEVDKNGEIDVNHLLALLSSHTKLLAFSYASNVTGNVQPLEEILHLVREKNILTLVDASQVVSHFPIDVLKLNCDFLVFSAHKVFGPSGVGILYAKKETHSLLTPSRYGGGMSNRVALERPTYNSYPVCFEAGTPNIEGILGFSKAIDYIQTIGFEAIHEHVKELEIHFRNKLKEIPYLKTLPFAKHHLPIFTFTTQNSQIDTKSLTQILSDSYNIYIRGGFHCSQPFFEKHNLPGGIRASLHIYNIKEEIDRFFEVLKDLEAFFSI